MFSLSKETIIFLKNTIRLVIPGNSKDIEMKTDGLETISAETNETATEKSIKLICDDSLSLDEFMLKVSEFVSPSTRPANPNYNNKETSMYIR